MYSNMRFYPIRMQRKNKFQIYTVFLLSATEIQMREMILIRSFFHVNFEARTICVLTVHYSNG